MEFKKLNSEYVAKVRGADYKIDWDKVVSKPQKKVKDFLYNYWEFDDVYEELRIPGSKLRIDLLNYSQKVAIEISPESSHSYNKFFHKNRAGGFLASVKRDLDKEKWCGDNDLFYICLKETDLSNLCLMMFEEKGLKL